MKQHHRFRAYIHLLRIQHPIGNFLLLWPTLWALWLAGNGRPSLKSVILFTLGVFLMRGLGCVINDIADRNFDGLVSRTKTRPLATGALALKDALIFLIVLCFLALCLVLQFNRLTLKLSFIGLILALIYPYMKRFTYWPQGVLGLAFSWGIPMAFAAEMNTVPPVAWLLFISASIWPLAYDTIYAMVDREDDKKIGIKSTALFWGKRETLFIGFMQGSFIISLVYLGFMLQVNLVFYLALGFVGTLFIYQHYLIKDRNPEHCLKAFLNNNWVGALLFLGFILGCTTC